MSYVVFGVIVLLVISLGYNYIQHNQNVKALREFVGTTKALKSAESENEKMTKALALFVGDGETQVEIRIDESHVNERISELDELIGLQYEALDSFKKTYDEALREVHVERQEALDRLEELCRRSDAAYDSSKQKILHLQAMNNHYLQRVEEIEKRRLEEASKFDKENKELGLVLAELVDTDGEVLHKIRLPGSEARPNITPCGPLCGYAFWRTDEKYANKAKHLRARYGHWHCAAMKNENCDYARSHFLDGENQCTMFFPSERAASRLDMLEDEELSRGAIASHAKKQEGETALVPQETDAELELILHERRVRRERVLKKWKDK